MKRYACFFFVLMTALFWGSLPANALQPFDEGRPFEGEFCNVESGVLLSINLYDTVMVVPRYEFLGPVNGYLHGNIHENWFVTSFSFKKDNVVELQLSDELGSTSQTIVVTDIDCLTLEYECQGGNAIRKVVQRKWTKAPASMMLKRRR